MKLRHISATDPYGFQGGLDIAQDEAEEDGEIVMSIDHSVSQSTFPTEFGNETEITYSAILCCMDFQGPKE